MICGLLGKRNKYAQWLKYIFPCTMHQCDFKYMHYITLRRINSCNHQLVSKIFCSANSSWLFVVDQKSVALTLGSSCLYDISDVAWHSVFSSVDLLSPVCFPLSPTRLIISSLLKSLLTFSCAGLQLSRMFMSLETAAAGGNASLVFYRGRT